MHILLTNASMSPRKDYVSCQFKEALMHVNVAVRLSFLAIRPYAAVSLCRIKTNVMSLCRF